MANLEELEPTMYEKTERKVSALAVAFAKNAMDEATTVMQAADKANTALDAIEALIVSDDDEDNSFVIKRLEAITLTKNATQARDAAIEAASIAFNLAVQTLASMTAKAAIDMAAKADMLSEIADAAAMEADEASRYSQHTTFAYLESGAIEPDCEETVVILVTDEIAELDSEIDPFQNTRSKMIAASIADVRAAKKAANAKTAATQAKEAATTAKAEAMAAATFAATVKGKAKTKITIATPVADTEVKVAVASEVEVSAEVAVATPDADANM